MIRLIKGLTSLVLVTMMSGTAYAGINLDSWIEWLIREECKRQGVEAAFPLAVASTESGKGNRKFRTGLIGWPKQYWAPFNIHPDFLRRGWRVDLLPINIQVGVTALRGSDRRRILRRYNAEFNEDYYKAVLAKERKYREAVGRE